MRWSGSFLLCLFEGSGVYEVSYSWLEQFPSVQQGVNSPEEGMYDSQGPSAPPPPSSWQNGPPRVGEGYRDHMTLPQGPGQLLGCQQKPRLSKALLLSPAQGWPPLLASSYSCGCAWPGTFLSSGHRSKPVTNQHCIGVSGLKPSVVWQELHV